MTIAEPIPVPMFLTPVAPMLVVHPLKEDTNIGEEIRTM
jgi:hypothetical protein